MPKSRNTRRGRKKRKPSVKKRRNHADVSIPSVPLKSTERLFHQMGIDASENAHDEHRAQALIYDAWEMVHAQDRIDLAKQALALWPDCADAWVILADDAAMSLPQALDYYQQAQSAGERALGVAALDDDLGHFWGILETRPYMRARAGLAGVLKAMGRIDEAADHWRDLLRLNPTDNQGNRYDLLQLLLQYGRDDEAADLLDIYAGDAMAEWCYAHALLTYRQQDASDKADESLAIALERNTFVPAYLLGRRRIPKLMPEMISIGSKDEAIAYAVDYKAIWAQTPGALDWLRASQGKSSA